ncbi:MAG: hypothetical protein F6K18_22090 [Okeania sp. SIO2C2]|uniref:hypothetical protein n=1 Tax=unclassified Okeania TaxID=2634635 RepID=UPI0013B9C9C3|nr:MULTISPECIES: hypothetical protein [unclassified Okeania]NEP07559.1 hypothetical protein [Okeania sp. SIO4D6]NEP43818.1 hypothetical protein [Okeania sp. SIO2H7]NEP72464.1 hypothetical protein [Okeania sp. SIO2G5]NEP89307.1 hypothetical protein [Okeania sp. SIO2C2]NEP93125.1 hypothetical protein [Okeania sp. SIO2F5]
MTQLIKNSRPKKNNIFSTNSLSAEELERRAIERKKRGESCFKIFEKIRPRLIKNYYNWFIAIEPESGYYLLDNDLKNLMKRLTIYCPTSQLVTYRINETGACGKI